MLAAVFAYVFVMGGGRGGPGTSTDRCRTLHLQRPDPHQPAGHCLGGIGSAVPRLGLLIFPLFKRQTPGAGAGGMSTIPTSREPAMRSSRAFCCSPPSWPWCQRCSWSLTALKSDEEYAIDKLGPAGNTRARAFPLGSCGQPLSRLDGQQLHSGGGRGCCSAPSSPALPPMPSPAWNSGPRHAAGRQHLADGGAADRDDRAALRALHAARPDQHLSGRHHHLCRAHHALLGLSAHHLFPHRAEGTVRSRPASTAPAIS